MVSKVTKEFMLLLQSCKLDRRSEPCRVRNGPDGSNLQRSTRRTCRLSGRFCRLCRSEGSTQLTATVFCCKDTWSQPAIYSHCQTASHFESLQQQQNSPQEVETLHLTEKVRWHNEDRLQLSPSFVPVCFYGFFFFLYLPSLIYTTSYFPPFHFWFNALKLVYLYYLSIPFLREYSFYLRHFYLHPPLFMNTTTAWNKNLALSPLPTLTGWSLYYITTVTFCAGSSVFTYYLDKRVASKTAPWIRLLAGSFYQRKSGFFPISLHTKIVIDKETLKQRFLPVLLLSLQIQFRQ